MLEELQGQGLMVHHWDTDGICSARLLLEKLSNKKIENKTPILGNYFLTDKELKNYSKYDFIIVVDMSLPEDNIKKLAEKSKILIFDHHLGSEIREVFHHNPVVKGGNPDEYPSASWIINKFLGNDVNLFALLGVVGDHEQRIKNNKLFYEIITDFCQKNNLSFDNMLKIVYLLDSNYKLGDKKAVEKAPHLLLTYNDADEILKNEKWNKNLITLNDEIEKQIEKPSKEIQGMILKKINTKYNIISTVTRKIAWDTGKDTIVINTGFFDDKDQIYVRSNKNLEPLIEQGKSLGYKCGGKKEVFGVITPKDKTDSFVEKILVFLKQR
ncbi:MAG: DHH family phosphoesterase [Candidatus Thermoplasmatota archaeon]|jgi:single-stranded DNA-specific DHH superfamily exonuclease|nr:DHH family phosphoesterase [Candidatus Thermoplasmatota archaeon]